MLATHADRIQKRVPNYSTRYPAQRPKDPARYGGVVLHVGQTGTSPPIGLGRHHPQRWQARSLGTQYRRNDASTRVDFGGAYFCWRSAKIRKDRSKVTTASVASRC